MPSFNLTTATNLFKIKYGKLSEQTYNSANVLLGRVKKEYNFTGRRMDVSVPTSFSGGVGSGALPTANSAAYEMAQITAKKVYSVIEVDREAIQASENDEGAFVRMTKETVKKGVESFNRNVSRILFNDGTGSLGVSTAAIATGTAAAPVIIISTATFKAANFEEKDYVNIGTATNVYNVGNVWEITAVAPGTRTITLARISGSVDLTGDAGAKTVTMQNSQNLDPAGLKGVLDATSGSQYGITVGRRWQAFQKAAGSAGLTTDLMNECMLGVEQQCGKVPNLIITSYSQYRKLLNQLEDQKQYLVEPRSPELKGKVSFRGVEFMSNAGPVGVFVDRFVEDDRMYFLNDNYITLYHRPGSPGWADDDGTVFLRKAASDEFQARYVSYFESYIVPPFQGVLSGLA